LNGTIQVEFCESLSLPFFVFMRAGLGSNINSVPEGSCK